MTRLAAVTAALGVDDPDMICIAYCDGDGKVRVLADADDRHLSLVEGFREFWSTALGPAIPDARVEHDGPLP